MSTILQALQRAEADRGRGQVPGLHAAPVAPTSPVAGSPHAPSSHPAALRSPWVGLGAGAVLLLGGLLVAWVGLQRPGLATPPLASPTPAVAAVAAIPEIYDKNVAPAQSPVATSASDSIAKSPDGPAPLAAVPPPGAHTGGKTPVVVRAVASASGPTTTAPASASASAPVATTAAAPAAPAITPLVEAPDEVRRLIPPLVISGAVHSNERSQRMVIANGQVLHEGDAWGSEAVVIDEIRPRSVVLKVRGQRVMLPL